MLMRNTLLRELSLECEKESFDYLKCRLTLFLTKDNQLVSEGVKGISVGLKVNTSLTKLNLNCEFMKKTKTTRRNNHLS